MATTIDHLSVGAIVRVIRAFTDRRGVRQETGARGTITALRLDLAEREIAIEWRRGERHESMHFPLIANDGPANGRMREYFAVEQEPIAARLDRSATGAAGSVPSSTTDNADRHSPLDRAVTLAQAGQFDAANAALAELVAARTDDLARALTNAASGLQAAAHPAAAWLAERAIDHWHAWGSEATSGGDGFARMLEIGPAVKRLRAITSERNGGES